MCTPAEKDNQKKQNNLEKEEQDRAALASTPASEADPQSSRDSDRDAGESGGKNPTPQDKPGSQCRIH